MGRRVLGGLRAGVTLIDKGKFYALSGGCLHLRGEHIHLGAFLLASALTH